MITKTIVALLLHVVALAAGTALREPSLYNSTITTIEELTFDENSRIIGGIPAKAGEFPHQVALKVKGGFCGASLICDSWVLTAAHCMTGARRYTMYFGAINTNKPTEPGRVIMESDSAVIHPHYNENNLHNDIGLIRLKQKLSFTTTIKAIPLDTNNIGAGVTLRVSGWGKTSDSSSAVSPTLNYVDIRTITNRECAQVFGSTITDNTLCCRGNPHHGTCNGDSGGPLIDPIAKKQIGVVSFVHKSGCSKGKPHGYVRVAKYRDWILKTIGGSCDLAKN